MEEAKRKKPYGLWAALILIGVVIVIWIISMLLKPKIDYDSMAKELLNYAYTFDNVDKIEAIDDDIFHVTVKSDPWYAASEKDKMIFCKKMNEGITVICQKYKVIRDIDRAAVYYYDGKGIKVAEPGKGVTLESKILH